MNSGSMWVDGGTRPDSHVAFRGRTAVVTSTTARVWVYSTCPFLLFVDGNWIGEGPVRWSREDPLYQEFELSLDAGHHLIAIHAHFEGVETRIMEQLSPFLVCELEVGTGTVPVDWKTSELPGFSKGARRINPQLGWIDWLDTREAFEGWHSIAFDDSKWHAPNEESTNVRAPSMPEIRFPGPRHHLLKPIKEGVLTEEFGYDADEPQAQVFLRDLDAAHGPPQGVWRRYDLGRVRLGRPLFALDVPPGTIVEFVLSESLAHGRVSPWITLSAGPSCNLDRYVARGGVQEFMPATVKAGRFLEVHVIGNPKAARFVKESFAERTYHGEPEGSFQCSDKRLERVWETGVETYRACSEDSVIDNPTRERGEWIGDSLTVGLENAAVAYSDLSLFRKALRQAAVCAREDGLVAGLCPGTVSYLSTYACHWVTAGMRLFELTGDRKFLARMFPAADRNMHAFSEKLTEDGLVGDLGWAFIDWGYVGSNGRSEMGLNLIYLGALRSMMRWCEAVDEDASHHRANAKTVETAIRKYLDQEFAKPEPWMSIGLQRTVLAMSANLVGRDRIPEAIRFLKAHYRSCFPNDPFAPHLANPATAQPRLITPFFSHFALPILWEHREAEFVLDQYRTCWGWALDQGLTTWPEVFDLRWSHCHQWSGCPTWQLTRYVIGLSARQDLGQNTFEFRPSWSPIRHASAKIPIPESKHVVKATYQTEGNRARWSIETPVPLRLRIDGKTVEVERRYEHTI